MATPLPHEQVQALARAGKMMLYIVNNMTGVSNVTSVQMAGFLLHGLRSNTSDIPVTQLVGMLTMNESTTPADAEHFLSQYDLLPTDRKHGRATFWVAMVVISGITLALRFFTRIRLAGGLKKDDWLLLSAWIVGSTLNIEETYRIFAAKWEFHVWFLTLDQLKLHGLLGTVDDFLFFLASALYKMALLIFFHGLSTNRTFRFFAYLMMFLTWLYTLLCMVYLGIMCTPIDTWNHPFTVKCLSHGRDFFIAIMCCNMAVDVLILALPISVVYKLDLRTAEKAMVMGLIGLGSFVCICSIMRITCVDPYLHNSDQTWANLPLTDWTVLEVHLGIVCASAPMLRKLLLHIAPKLRGSLTTGIISISSRSPSEKSSSGAKSVISAEKRDSALVEDDKSVFAEVTPSGTSDEYRKGHKAHGQKSMDPLDMAERNEEPVRYHYSFDDMRVVRSPRDEPA